MAQVSKINMGGIDYDIRDKVLEQEVANIKPIVNQGTINNAADEEDLTSENSLLKLKDRSTLNGMGYVILRKNKSFAEQVTQENTIYEVRHDFDLGGAKITLPDGCKFVFVGGKISNGELHGNILNDYVTPQMFGAEGNGVSDDTQAFQNAISVSHHVKVPNGIYKVKGVNVYKQEQIATAKGLFINKSNFTFECSEGAIFLKYGDTTSTILDRYIIQVGLDAKSDSKISNITICGGKYVGNREAFSPESSEENHSGIGIFNTENSRVENCHISDNQGDSLIMYGNVDLVIRNVISERSKRTGFSIGNADGLTIEGCRSYYDGADWTYSSGFNSGALPRACVCWEYESSTHSKEDEINKTIIRNNYFAIDGVKNPLLIGNCFCSDFINVERNYFVLKEKTMVGSAIVELSPTSGNVNNVNITNNIVICDTEQPNYAFVRLRAKIDCLTIQGNNIRNIGLADMNEDNSGDVLDYVNINGNDVYNPNGMFVQVVGAKITNLDIISNNIIGDSFFIFQRAGIIEKCSVIANNLKSINEENSPVDNIMGTLSSFRKYFVNGNIIESGKQYFCNGGAADEIDFIFTNNNLLLKGATHQLTSKWQYFPCLISNNVIIVPNAPANSLKFNDDQPTERNVAVINNIFRGKVTSFFKEDAAGERIINVGNVVA